jgi:hypothetical protein
VLDTILGYKIEFRVTPSQARRPRSGISSEIEQQLLQEEVQTLLRKGAIIELSLREATHGFYSSMFLIPKKDGDMRPVINLKGLNQPQHFKMEGIHTLKNLLKQNDWMTKVDLKDAYFAIPIHPTDRKFLRFSVQDHSYQFTCLPFRLSCAPWIITKTLKPVITLLRELGVKLVVYIDDILLMAESKAKALEMGVGLTYLLQCLGFTVNSEKSILEPTQELEFLGVLMNSVSLE